MSTSPGYLPTPIEQHPGLQAKSSGPLGGRTRQTLNLARATSRNTSWRFKRYSAPSKRLPTDISPQPNVTPTQRPPVLTTPPQLLCPRAVRFYPTFAELARNAGYSCLLNSNTPACGRLIRRAFAPHELSSLIKTIFSRKDEGDAVRRLVGEDVQTFVDVIDEVRSISTYCCRSAD